MARRLRSDRAKSAAANISTSASTTWPTIRPRPSHPRPCATRGASRNPSSGVSRAAATAGSSPTASATRTSRANDTAWLTSAGGALRVVFVPGDRSMETTIRSSAEAIAVPTRPARRRSSASRSSAAPRSAAATPRGSGERLFHDAAPTSARAAARPGWRRRPAAHSRSTSVRREPDSPAAGAGSTAPGARPRGRPVPAVPSPLRARRPRPATGKTLVRAGRSRSTSSSHESRVPCR